MKKTRLLSYLGTVAVLSLNAVPGHAVSLVGLTTDNRLTTFDSASPATMSPFVNITGVTSGARIVGIDTRPSDNSIYGVATDNKLYRIDSNTGNASVFSTLTGATISPSLSYGIDFNPVADAGTGASLRLVSSIWI